MVNYINNDDNDIDVDIDNDNDIGRDNKNKCYLIRMIFLIKKLILIRIL